MFLVFEEEAPLLAVVQRLGGLIRRDKEESLLLLALETPLFVETLRSAKSLDLLSSHF
jgi:hypothetical protein